MTTAKGTDISAEETLFADSVAGVLKGVWPAPECAATGSLERVWDVAAEQGWFELGSEGELGFAMAAMSALGRVGCPLPLVDGFVAARLFAEQEKIARTVAEGVIRPIVVPAGGDIAAFVEGAQAATHALVLPRGAGTVLLRAIVEVTETPGLPIPAWSGVRLGEVTVSAEIEAAAGESWDLLRLGLAHRALAAAETSHRAACDHAVTRRQFGRAIGSFGAVQQRAAAAEIALRCGQLLLADAVARWSAGDECFPLATALAVEQVAAAAPRLQFAAHHTLAAIGFFEEHPAPWLFRRVNADIARLHAVTSGSSSSADLLLAGARLPVFDLGPRAEELRSELVGVLHGHLGASVPAAFGADDPAVVRALARAGIFGMGWPREFGGRGASVEEMAAFTEEMGFRRVPAVVATVADTLLGNALVAFGTPEQRAALLPRIAAGDLTMCVGYSEPEAGSDLASLRTRADRDGDGWVINGQKIWTSNAHRSDYVFLAVRTDQDATPPHAGISVFLVPLTTPGITIAQHVALTGEISCSVFYDDVHVGADALIGEPNGGWKVINHLLVHERVFLAGRVASIVLRGFSDLLEAVAATPGVAGERGSAARRQLSRLAVEVQACRALVIAAVRAAADGGGGRMEAPMAKIVGADLAEDLGLAAIELLGPGAALGPDVPDVPGGGAFEYVLRSSIMDVVGGGTNDILRGVIARTMGLPR